MIAKNLEKLGYLRISNKSIENSVCIQMKEKLTNVVNNLHFHLRSNA